MCFCSVDLWQLFCPIFEVETRKKHLRVQFGLMTTASGIFVECINQMQLKDI